MSQATCPKVLEVAKGNPALNLSLQPSPLMAPSRLIPLLTR